jgi:hypothetical protein
VIDKDTFIYYKDEPNTKGVLGINYNRIVEIPNFIDPETSTNMIEYFESKAALWGDIAFYGSSGMGLAVNDPSLDNFNLDNDFFDKLKERFREAVEEVFDRPVKPNTSHAQKWDVGGFASPHSDNSDHDGHPNAFEINKYVGILYLNNNYEGGELYFVEENNEEQQEVTKEKWNTYLSFKPNPYSFIIFPGGVENIHGVSEILEGTRYTMVSFWDFAEAEYDEETLDRWEEEERQVRIAQAKQKEEWEKGNKYA